MKTTVARIAGFLIYALALWVAANMIDLFLTWRG